MELPSATKVRARQVGWEEALIERLEESPARPDQVLHLVEAKITGERVKLLMAQAETGTGAPGEALDDALLVACGTGALRLVTLQRSGRGVMDGATFLRGFAVPRGTRLG